MKNVKMKRIALWVVIIAIAVFVVKEASANQDNPIRISESELRTHTFPSKTDPGTMLMIETRSHPEESYRGWTIDSTVTLSDGTIGQLKIDLSTGYNNTPQAYSFHNNVNFSNKDDTSIQPNNDIPTLLGHDSITFNHLPLYLQNQGNGTVYRSFTFKESMDIVALHLENCDLQTFKTTDDSEINCELILNIAMQTTTKPNEIQLFSISLGKPVVTP